MTIFQIVFEATLFLLVVWFGFWQVILPLSKNQKVFPILRKDLAKAEESLKEVGQQVAVDEVLAEKDEMKKKLRNKRKSM